SSTWRSDPATAYTRLPSCGRKRARFVGQQAQSNHGRRWRAPRLASGLADAKRAPESDTPAARWVKIARSLSSAEGGLRVSRNIRCAQRAIPIAAHVSQ